MPMFKLVNEDGVWLEDARLGAADWKPGGRTAQGRESLEVVEVRDGGEETPVLVVRSEHGSRSD